MGDARFFGDAVSFPNRTLYGDGVRVWNQAFRVQNPDGAWQSELTYGLDIPDPGGGHIVSVFHGEGAYEGLSAIVELTARGALAMDLRGVIVDGVPPSDPEPAPFE